LFFPEIYGFLFSPDSVYRVSLLQKPSRRIARKKCFAGSRQPGENPPARRAEK
jgi:hypothetical protein